MTDKPAALRDHLRHFFSRHPFDEQQWKRGAAVTEMPDLRIAVVAPGPKSSTWFYSTLGASDFGPKPGGIEFFMLSMRKDERYVELLTIVAYYHRDHHLDLHHTAPVGEPLLHGSNLEFVYISLPYTFGPELEVCNVGEEEIHFFWVFPITREEKEFAKVHGYEELERRFEAAAVEYWSPNRKSVISRADQ